MTRAIITAFHKYTPFGGEYYQPILDLFLQNMKKYRDEYNHLYLVDSNWGIPESPDYTVLKVSPHLRYYDAYKEVLPQIKEDLVLFMDNDMLIYRENVIRNTFDTLRSDPHLGEKPSGEMYIKHPSVDVVSIYDTCGTYTTDKLNGKNKFCPYWFATRKELLMKYRDVDWASSMPEYETLGKLTKKMLEDNINPHEWEEDKSSIYFDGMKDGEKSKDLGYYHVRSGSVPAILLAWKNSPDHYHTYETYMVNQPRREYLRQFAWYYVMTDTNKETWSLRPRIWELLKDTHIDEFTWMDYFDKFKRYHGL